MPAMKEQVHGLVDTLTDGQLLEMTNFIFFIKKRDGNAMEQDLISLSASSTDFWDNEIDNEVWNNV